MLSLVAISAAVVVGCFAQAVAGTGLGLISGGILVALLGREASIMLLTLISVPMMLAVAWQNRRGIIWSRALLIGGTALVLTPLLAVGMRALNQEGLMIICGLLILASVTLLYVGVSAPKLASKTGAVIVGASTSVLNMLSGSGGPPAAIYAVNANWSPTTTRGTLQIIFLMVGIGTVFSLDLPEWQPEVFVVAAGSALVGTIGGMLVSKRIPPHLARLSILALATLGGLIVLISGLVQMF